MTPTEQLRRLVAARLGVPWRSVRIKAGTKYRTRWCRRFGATRFRELVATTGCTTYDLGAFGTRPRWMIARAVLYERSGAITDEARDAFDLAHPPLHGRVGKMT